MSEIRDSDISNVTASNLIIMPANSYKAKLINVKWETASFEVAGTLDGFIDLATPNGTYPLNLEEAGEIAAALIAAISDVKLNCLHERDALLVESRS